MTIEEVTEQRDFAERMVLQLMDQLLLQPLSAEDRSAVEMGREGWNALLAHREKA